MNRLILSTFLICTLAACSVGARGPVTFTVAINPEWFNNQTPLTVIILNQSQIDALKDSAGCWVRSISGSKSGEMVCPPGVTAEPISAEEFTFDIRQVGAHLEIPSTSVYAGERFRLTISGVNQDECNQTSGTIEWVAETETVPLGLDDLMWGTTQETCLQLP